MRVGVVGGGASGLVSAYVLAREGVDVVLFETEDHVGSHTKTHGFTADIDLDLGLTVLDPVAYPSMLEVLENLGIEMETSEMSFSVSLKGGKGYEWGTRNGSSGLMAQKKNVLNPHFWQMFRDIRKFEQDMISYLEVRETNPDLDGDETLGDFVKSRGYSESFQKGYLMPICGAIWLCSPESVLSFSASSVLSFCRNHHLLQLFGRSQWLTLKGLPQYLSKVRKELEARSCKTRASCQIKSISATEEGCILTCEDGLQEKFDRCILALQAPDALRLLGDKATYDESRVLGAFHYVYSEMYLHHDKSLMPQKPAAWSACNFLRDTEDEACMTYWLNVLQNLGEESEPVFVTVNPISVPENVLLKWSVAHPLPSVAAWKASQELHGIQGKRGLWFSGAYQGYGVHQHGLKAGFVTASSLLGKDMYNNPKHMTPSFVETGARVFVIKFLERFISTGRITLLEDGGKIFIFEGKHKKCPLKSILKVHSPQFYWKIMTRADIGLADAFIDGDFSFVDKDNGLINFLMILVANRDFHSSRQNLGKKRGWWTLMFHAAGIVSVKYFLRHTLRQNTLTEARRNISRHYDLSNEFFSLYLDETMNYSSAIFKSEAEDLRAAQLRKMHILIDKAQILESHEVLDIGCGWGSLAIEMVRRTGCKYTGITLSEEQLNYARAKVKEVGLQDRITFLICDYRELPPSQKFDRIVSCEMIEHVGHEYMEAFFRSCESVLAEDGIFVLQFISIPDERYDAYRLSSDFIKEYIFPGGCLPSLSRVTSAMASSSRLCVEHIENIGIHYSRTLRCWRKNFLENQSKIQNLGFDEKFIRTWEYYFDYCAAGFRTRTLGDYQVVFSRPGNTTAFGDPYESLPSP